MSDENHGRVMSRMVHEQAPEVIPVMRELHALGMIDGWRDVVYVGPARERGVEYTGTGMELCKRKPAR